MATFRPFWAIFGQNWIFPGYLQGVSGRFGKSEKVSKWLKMAIFGHQGYFQVYIFIKNGKNINFRQNPSLDPRKSHKIGKIAKIAKKSAYLQGVLAKIVKNGHFLHHFEVKIGPKWHFLSK